MRANLAIGLLPFGLPLATALSGTPAQHEPRAATSTLPYCTQATPTPTGSSCGNGGKLKTAAVLQKISNTALDLCLDACGGNTKCQSVSVAYADSGAVKTCTLYSKTLKAQGYVSNKTPSNPSYYDRSCLTCAKGCTLGFANGGFESGSIAPWNYTSSTFFNESVSLTSPGAGGSQYAVNITHLASTSAASYIDFDQDFQWCVGTNYTVGFSYLAPVGSDASIYFYSGSDNDFEELFQTFVIGDGTWHSFSTTQEPKQSPSGDLTIEISFGNNNTATVLLDNIVVAPTKK